MSGTTNFAGISFSMDTENIYLKRDEEMCNRWSEKTTNFKMMEVKTYKNPYGNFKVTGNINNMNGVKVPSDGNIYVKFWAPSPPTYVQSFSGSGLPYANFNMAYENTPNKGTVPLVNNSYSFDINFPNSYYDHMGKTYVGPEVNICLVDSSGNEISPIHKMPLGNGIPFRTLTFPPQRNWANGPMFYCNDNLPYRTQEQILRDSAYPSINEVPPNFWGLDPPH